MCGPVAKNALIKQSSDQNVSFWNRKLFEGSRFLLSVGVDQFESRWLVPPTSEVTDGSKKAQQLVSAQK